MESFEVENFRSLKHLKLEKLARVNLLVGKNNSGKTSVLEGLYTLSGIDSPVWFESLLRGRETPLAEADFHHLFNGFDNSRSIILSATYNSFPIPVLPSTMLKASLLFMEPDTQRALNNLEWELDRSSQRLLQDDGLQISLQTDATTSPVFYELVSSEGRALRRFSLRGISADALPSIKRIRSSTAFRTTATMISSRTQSRNLSTKIEQLKVSKSDGELIEIIRQIDSRIERIELGSTGQIYFNLGIHFPTLVPVGLMGEGTVRLLDVISTVANRAGGLVYIDEIDNGLHYSALRILWKSILQAARKYDVQVFATTHSAEALRHLTAVLEDEEYADYRNDIAAYTLIRAKDDTVHSFRYDYEQLDFAMEHDVEVRN